MDAIAVFAETTVETNIRRAFETIVPINLTTIFTGYKFFPAVIGTRDVTGDWDAAGQTRIVCLSDGSEAQEQLASYHPTESFSYKISGFTGSLKYLAKSAEGEWWFEKVSENSTHVKWRYAFNPVSIFTLPILWIVAKIFWVGYMTNALAICKRQSEEHE